MPQAFTASERIRLRLAVAASLLIHFALLAAGGPGLWRTSSGPLPDPAPPLVVNLRPEPVEPPRQVVESNQPATKPVGETDLISDRNSNAQDPQESVEGTKRVPLASRESEHYELGPVNPPPPVQAAPPPAPQPKSQQPPAPKPAPEKPQPKAKPAEKKPAPKGSAPPKDKAPKEVTAVAKAGAPDAASESPAEKAAREAAQEAPAAPPTERAPVAQAEPPAPLLGRFQGSVEGGIKGKGFLGFEAMEDEVAPYLLEIRKRVERHWRAAMALRFVGTTPTKAAVECAISPDGKLQYAKIVESGKVVGFAPLCKESIEKAAPFAPFPFEVPEMYRNKNLEIRWTFEFM